MSKIVMFLVVAVLVFIAGSFGYQMYQNHLETDLNMAVPLVGPERMGMFKTTAIQLSAEEVEKASGSGFFSYVEKFIKIERRTNPITISGKDIEKVPPTNPNVQPLKDVVLFRSCFYNSKDHDLSSRTGLFAAQALLFKNKRAADLLEKDFSICNRNHYTVVLRKGNIVGAVNMFLSVKPTKELFELVAFAKKHGFHATVVDSRTTKN